MLDDAARRQLRFSLFLQSFAALMMVGAFAVRVTSVGWDGVTALLAGGVVIIVAAGVFTVRRLRAG
jgi:predicted membrane channel-forming protein YqfA (hemolysin III family)